MSDRHYECPACGLYDFTVEARVDARLIGEELVFDVGDVVWDGDCYALCNVCDLYQPLKYFELKD